MRLNNLVTFLANSNFTGVKLQDEVTIYHDRHFGCPS